METLHPLWSRLETLYPLWSRLETLYPLWSRLETLYPGVVGLEALCPSGSPESTYFTSRIELSPREVISRSSTRCSSHCRLGAMESLRYCSIIRLAMGAAMVLP